MITHDRVRSDPRGSHSCTLISLSEVKDTLAFQVFPVSQQPALGCNLSDVAAHGAHSVCRFSGVFPRCAHGWREQSGLCECTADGPVVLKHVLLTRCPGTQQTSSSICCGNGCWGHTGSRRGARAGPAEPGGVGAGAPSRPRPHTFCAVVPLGGRGVDHGHSNDPGGPQAIVLSDKADPKEHIFND